MLRMQIHSAYDGLRFYVASQLYSLSVSIPSLMPDPGYTGAVSYRKPINDELLGEGVALCAVIRCEINGIKTRKNCTCEEIDKALAWIAKQIIAEMNSQSFALKKHDAERMFSDVNKLTAALEPYLRKREVIR